MTVKLPNTAAFFLLISTLVLDTGVWALWKSVTEHFADGLIIGLACILIGGVLTVTTANDIKEFYGS